MATTVSVKKNAAYVAVASAGAKVKVGGIYVAAPGLKIKSNGVYVGSGSVPANLTAPVVTGSATIFSTLTCTPGTWSGTPTPVLSRQWMRSGTPIPGAINLTYVLAVADAADTITCVETASNNLGSATKTSNGIVIP